jgi:uncharacterized protein (DUF1800 family)
MNTHSRIFIRLLRHASFGTLSAGIIALAACQSGPRAPAVPPPQPLVHLPPEALTGDAALRAANRLGFGPTPGELEQINAMGVDRWITAQLTPARIPENPQLTAQLASLDTLNQAPTELYLRYQSLRREGKDDPEAKKAANEDARKDVTQAQTAHLLRDIESNRQFQEVLVGFWYNHFNVFDGKGLDRVWVGNYENTAIRPYVFGRFRDLLEATARHPAMLFYLDNWQNTAPGSPGARGKQDGLNENYARELMELHTLGVDGGYTQTDVTELARILTGWGLRQRGKAKGQPGDNAFAFDPARHDYGTKIFLGHTIAGKGPAEIEEALGILAASPRTAYHLSYQLAQYFVADEPDPALVAAMANAYLTSGSSLTAVYRAMIENPAFWAAPAVTAKFKTPQEYVVSAVRAGAVPIENAQPLIGNLQQLGMPIYGYETPDGYKMVEAAWLSPDGLARRLSFATALSAGRLPLDPSLPNGPGPLDEGKIRQAIGNQMSPQTENAVNNAAGPLKTAVLLGSPEFMHK